MKPAFAQSTRVGSEADPTNEGDESIGDELQALDPKTHNSKTADLEFEEFSYVDDQGKFRCIDGAWLSTLSDYLDEHYGVDALTETHPYLVVWCTDQVPAPSERPSKIAGLFAMWLVNGVDKYPKFMFVGQVNYDYRKAPLRLEEGLLDDLQVFATPKAETLRAIMDQHFPDALAISYIDFRIIVQFEEVAAKEYYKHLVSLPCAIANTEVAIRYNNGLI